MADPGASGTSASTSGGGPARGKGMWIGIVVVAIVIIILLAAVFGGFFGQAPRKYAIDLWYNSDGHYGDTEDELATVLKNSIEACGKVSVTLKSEIWAEYRVDRNQGNLPFFLLGWYPDYFDTDDYLSPFMAASGSPGFGSFYSNSEVEQWLFNEQTTTSTAARAENFTKLQNKLAEDVPYIPLFSGYQETAYVSGLQNVELHPISFKWFIIDKPAATEIIGSTTDSITSLDPAFAYDFFSWELSWNIFDTLVVYEPVDPALMAGLAVTVPAVGNGGISPDGRNYTYTLRPGLTFSDGTALNASVVKRSIERAIRINDPGGASFLLWDIGKIGRNSTTGAVPAGAIVADDLNRTVTFHLSAPVTFFNDLMAIPPAAPVPWNYDQDSAQPDTPAGVIGSGPYRLTQHVPNQQFVLERNTNYHTPGLYASFNIPTIPVEDKVTINRRQTSTALKTDLTVSPKLADVVYRTLSPEDLADLQAQSATLGIAVEIATSPFIRYLVFNVGAQHSVAITDVRVRQAIAYSVDRQAIDRDVFAGQVEPLYSLVPPGYDFSAPYYVPVFQTRYGDSNCTGANEIWTQLGYVVRFGLRDIIAKER